MRIVVLDEVYLQPQDIDKLRSVADKLSICKGNPASKEEVLARCQNSDIIILGWTNISREIMVSLTSLKLISVWATGTDYIDLVAAADNGIKVANVPHYASNSVAEYIIGAILFLSRKLHRAHNSVLEKKYDWAPFQGVELSGKTIGIVGLGDIGSKVAKLANGFDMHVLVNTRTPSKEKEKRYNITFVELSELFQQSDFISLNIPLNQFTEKIIGDKLLSQMKPGAILINASRAGIIDQDYLIEQLRYHKIGGAALDDFNRADDRLYGLDNVLLTPHIGFYTAESLRIKTEICVENVMNYLRGHPQNIVTIDS